MLEKALEKSKKNQSSEEKIDLNTDFKNQVNKDHDISNQNNMYQDSAEQDVAYQESSFQENMILEKVVENVVNKVKPQQYESSEIDNSISKKDIIRFNWDFLHQKGFIRVDDSHNKIAEEYRSIKRPLVTNALGSRKRDIENSNLILITSSIPGEGKTFTSINLAFSIAAEMDKKVLLIDADVKKPSVSKVLGIKSKIGLIDYLESDSIPLSDIILQTELKGLRIIPAGKAHRFSTELLASDRMIGLSRELSARYSDRIVIFDTPPILVTTQAEVLASQMGQVVLVIAADTTPKSFVNESVKRLQNCSDVVLALLNKSHESSKIGHYGYGEY